MELISLLISLAVILFLANVFKNHRKYANFPPGPKSLPLIGNMHIINTRKPQKSFMEISKTYGSVFSVQLGTERFVILCGYDAVKDALINHAEEFAGRPVTAMGSRTSQGYGILFANGENWKVMRRFTLSTLRDYGMGKKSIEDKIIEECECLMQKFKSYGGKPFDNLSVINAAVANIIVFILLDHRYEYDDPTILKLMNLINENVRIVGSVMIRLYNSFPSLIGWLPGKHNTIFENHNKMQNFVQDTFTRKEKELDINNQRNLIDAFLAKQQEGKPESKLYYHNKNLGMLVSNLFAAGMETTSTTLRWGLLLMMKYPEIQKKVQCEIENVIGSAQPQVEHRKEMPYTDAVIHEIQRFGDIVPGSLPHSTTKDITFRGYFLPKGTTVIPLLHSVLKDKAYFEKPEEFYPEHFLDSDGKFKRNEAFVPFSLGKRSCAGENLAKMEMFLFFTTLLQNFTFQAPPGAKLDLNPAPGLTNAPLPHEICAIPRR
ncbi:cytochrome P450 2K6-like isoform X3 [Ranitomeya imitator]